MPNQRLHEFLRRESQQLLELALALGSVCLVEALWLPKPLAWTVWAVVFTLTALIRAGTRPVETFSINILVRHGLTQLGIALVATAISAFLWEVSWRLLVFGPIWIIFSAATRFALLSTTRLKLRNFASLAGRHLTGRLERFDPQLITTLGPTWGIAYLSTQFWSDLWPLPWLFWVLLIGWSAGTLWYGVRSADITAHPWRLSVSTCLAFSALMLAWLLLAGHSPTRAHLCILLWYGLATGIATWWSNRRSQAPAKIARDENYRVLLLVLTTFWLMRGFARTTVNGTNDALWYGTVLADMIKQVRDGVFPVWTGQSEYQFNGAIYPLRVAPAFQYLGALLDLLTLQTLGTFSLQNLLLTLLGLAGGLCTYRVLRPFLTSQPWYALALTGIFLACPGVLGIAYYSDLYMSWTTLPWAVLAIGSTARLTLLQDERWHLWLLAGSALGLCWWGHSPIAMWVTGLVVVLSTLAFGKARLAGQPGSWRALAALAAFLSIAAYPIGSVLLFPPEASINAAGFQEAHPAIIVNFLNEVIPAVWLPLSPSVGKLSDFQLGYTLWSLLLACLVVAGRKRCYAIWPLLAASCVLLLLLTPIPGLAVTLWRLVPALVRNATSNWPMNRLYLPLAICITISTAALIRLAHPQLTPKGKRLLAAWIFASLSWSLFEAGKFGHRAALLARPTESAASQLRSENVMLTRFAYLIFPNLPASFSHGTMDPQLLQRISSDDPAVTIADNLATAAAVSHEVADSRLVPVAGDLIHAASTPFTLNPGQRYLLAFEFLPDGLSQPGVLQLRGKSLFREYELPAYGGPTAFGAGGSHSPYLPLWTSLPTSEQVQVRFFPRDPTRLGEEALAKVRLLAYPTGALPISMNSWIPYRATVTSPSAGWLETPRMFQTAYVATVNGKSAPVRKSPQGTVAIAVPAGTCKVQLNYVPPRGLAALFWLSLGAISVALGLVLTNQLHRPARP